jgi:hypothetical protein
MVAYLSARPTRSCTPLMQPPAPSCGTPVPALLLRRRRPSPMASSTPPPTSSMPWTLRPVGALDRRYRRARALLGAERGRRQGLCRCLRHPNAAGGASRVRAGPAPNSSSNSISHPSRRPPRTRPACPAATRQRRHQLDRVIGEVAVALLATGSVQDRDLGALGCTSMPTYTFIRASVPELVDSRSLGCRAEQATGPDLHSVSSVGVSSRECAPDAPSSHSGITERNDGAPLYYPPQAGLPLAPAGWRWLRPGS